MKIDLIPHSTLWIDRRNISITATDAPVIMGHSPWKTIRKLYDQKKGLADPESMNSAMQRGIDLEPEARMSFYRKTRMLTKAAVVVCDTNDRFMASLDGIDIYDTCVVEIKCPGKKTIELAEDGIIPQHYRDQIQWQMLCAGVNLGYYCCYDGNDCIIIPLDRDEEYIDKMIVEAEKFLWCLDNDSHPVDENSVLKIDLDASQAEIAKNWISTTREIKSLQDIEKDLRTQLCEITDDGNCELMSNSRTIIKMYRVERKGSVNWKNVMKAWSISEDDVEKFRGEQIGFWKIVDAEKESN